jgi:hypothetical protein
MSVTRRDIVSVVLIVFMVLMAVSTSQTPPREIGGRIGYERTGEYYVIQVRTVIDPHKYKLHTNFVLCYTEQEERQRFYSIDSLYIVSWEDNEGNLIEETLFDYPPFETYVDGERFVIKIKSELLKYANPRVDYIYLSRRDGTFMTELYVR